MKLLIRIIISIIIAILLSSMEVSGNLTILQILFITLIFMFTLSKRMLISFNLSKVLNEKIRKTLKSNIEHSRNMLFDDFLTSFVVVIVATIYDERYLHRTFDIMLMAIIVIIVSLIYQAYNFYKLHKLKTDIENAIAEEELIE